MQILNAALLPWLIAEYGIDFASLDNQEFDTEMITHIITKHELGGYTTSTFPAIVEGHDMQRTAFSKCVLRQLSNSFVFMYRNMKPILIYIWLLSDKTANVHRNDLRNSLKKLLCCPREVSDRKKLVAAINLRVPKMSDIVLSRARLPFLESLCVRKGIISEPVLFQGKDDKEAKKSSILGRRNRRGEGIVLDPW